MRWVPFILLILAPFFSNLAAAQAVDWPLVARSHIIVVASPLLQNLDDGSGPRTIGTLQAVALKDAEFLKGSPSNKPLVVLLPQGQLLAHKGRTIFFLEEHPADPSYGFVLTNGSAERSLHPYSVRLAAEIFGELRRIAGFIEEAEHVADLKRDSSRGAEVRAFLGRISAASATPADQKSLMRELKATDGSGLLASTYLIAYLDDWRPFRAGTLAFEAESPDGFARDKILEPELMIDAIEAVLMRIPAVTEVYEIDRAFLGAAPSDEARRNAIQAWRAHFGWLVIRMTIWD